jgi:tRNA G37 N-methylase TrmD
MQFVVLTLFPELFDTFRNHGMIRRAIELQKISVQTIQIRDFAEGRHRVTDDRPYGGGPGMVMKPEPVAGRNASCPDGGSGCQKDSSDTTRQALFQYHGPAIGRGKRTHFVVRQVRGH